MFSSDTLITIPFLSCTSSDAVLSVHQDNTVKKEKAYILQQFKNDTQFAEAFSVIFKDTTRIDQLLKSVVF